MKSSFKTCAQEAGIGEGKSLHIVSEPEAAATYALHAMHPHDIKVGDTFGKLISDRFLWSNYDIPQDKLLYITPRASTTEAYLCS